MIWTLLAVVAVLATKFLTALRLRDLKAKLEEIQPQIDELRYKLMEAEDEFASLRIKQEAVEIRMTHLKGVVNYLETAIKSPGSTVMVPDEREQVLLAAEE